MQCLYVQTTNGFPIDLQKHDLGSGTIVKLTGQQRNIQRKINPQEYCIKTFLDNI